VSIAELSQDRCMTITGSSEAVVTVRGLRKLYGQRVVVDDLDFEVGSGEVVGLIGANGAGKTTTVECLQGLRRPDSGELRVLGFDPVHDVARMRERVGSQLQDSALPDRLRVSEALELFATRTRHQGEELLAQFGLAERRRSAFASLSGGERQRLFLVLALLNHPSLVILDELTQGLDPAARRDVWTAVTQLRDAGTTVLLVTHELDEAQALCDRVIAMRSGKILDQGSPAQLLARHGSHAQIRFTWTGPDVDGLTEALLRQPGVHSVEVGNRQVRVDGERRSISFVGAELVGRGHSPTDFDVEVPDLESALLALLDASDTSIPSGDLR
jgi:ABC-2 type transport system ATP-binding protein